MLGRDRGGGEGGAAGPGPHRPLLPLTPQPAMKGPVVIHTQLHLFSPTRPRPQFLSAGGPCVHNFSAIAPAAPTLLTSRRRPPARTPTSAPPSSSPGGRRGSTRRGGWTGPEDPGRRAARLLTLRLGVGLRVAALAGDVDTPLHRAAATGLLPRGGPLGFAARL